MGTRDGWIGWIVYRGCNKRLVRCGRCIGSLACTSLVRRVVQDMCEKGIPESGRKTWRRLGGRRRSRRFCSYGRSPLWTTFSQIAAEMWGRSRQRCQHKEKDWRIQHSTTSNAPSVIVSLKYSFLSWGSLLRDAWWLWIW